MTYGVAPELMPNQFVRTLFNQQQPMGMYPQNQPLPPGQLCLSHTSPSAARGKKKKRFKAKNSCGFVLQEVQV